MAVRLQTTILEFLIRDRTINSRIVDFSISATIPYGGIMILFAAPFPPAYYLLDRGEFSDHPLRFALAVVLALVFLSSLLIPPRSNRGGQNG